MPLLRSSHNCLSILCNYPVIVSKEVEQQVHEVLPDLVKAGLHFVLKSVA